VKAAPQRPFQLHKIFQSASLIERRKMENSIKIHKVKAPTVARTLFHKQIRIAYIPSIQSGGVKGVKKFR
jgi:hypothetical protein